MNKKGMVNNMLATEKTIRRAAISIDPAENYAIDMVNSIAETIIEMLEDNQATQISSLTTGELIDRNDLCRLRGILSGLQNSICWEIE